MLFLFLFKQKTAYDVRISDWSSDVCSSDTERDRAIGIGDAGERGRHMRLARHRRHRADHRGIDDVVRPELAVDHGGAHLRRRDFAKLRRHQPCSDSLGLSLCGAALAEAMLYCNDNTAKRPAAARIT